MIDSPAGPLFVEEQRLRSWWIRLLVGGLALFAWFSAISQFVFHRPIGNHPASDNGMWVILALTGVGLPILMLLVKMTVRVVDDAVVVQIRPILTRGIPFESIERCEVVTYRPVRDYGGRGIRWSGHGWAYMLSGNRGVKLYRDHDDPILIGSDRPEELADRIRAGLARVGINRGAYSV